MKTFLLLFLGFLAVQEIGFAQQAEYDRLKAKIEAEEGEPHSDGAVSKDFEEYIHWLGVKAADRDQARDLASKYSLEGNPYWEERFLNLVELAQESGESTLWMANYIFLRIKTKTGGIAGDNWHDAVFKADYYGKRLFQRAAELSFDANYIRESVRCLMRFALGNVETGYVALYYGRKLEHGTQYDSEGNLLMPNMDFDILCLPRSAFHLVSKGRQLAPVDDGLSWVEEIRKICEWFELFEYTEGTDLMNQFLLDFLCDDKANRDKNLHWYLSLARKYKLEKSEKQILRFYGTLYGKVEVREGEQTRDAPGARVKVTDDTNTLKTEADGTGNYTIEKAPLHCKCPPVAISAEFEGDRVDTKYKGELSEPDPESRQKKDLMIMGSGYAWNGTINLEITERLNCNVEEKTSELGRREVTAADEKKIVTNMSVGTDDFDLPTQSTNARGKLRYVSGDLTVRLQEDHDYKGYAEKTECVSNGKRQWVSPGNWTTRNETMSGQAYREIKMENLTMLIVKDIGYNKSTEQKMQSQTQDAAKMMEIQRQLAEAGKNVDRKAIEEMKEQMVKMVQGDKNSKTFPVIIRVQLAFGGKPDPVATTYDYVNYDICLDKEDNESRSNILDYPLVNVVSAEFKGTYTRGDNGQDKITARVDSTETMQGSYYPDICPEKIIIANGEITLERHKK